MKSFIKYNLHLVSLKLENTGLNPATIVSIASLLRRSQAIRCLHLSANEGITPELCEWIRKRIHAVEKIEPHSFKSYIQVKKEFNKLDKASMKLGEALFKAKHMAICDEIKKENQWMQIREGLKLRNVNTLKRMNDVGTYMGEIDMEGSFLAKTLIISRILGSKHLQPGSAQWRVLDDKKDECWKCGQYVLTLFLWNPRIGALTSDKDPVKTKYYKEQMDSMRDTDELFPMNMSSTPLFASSFNGWKY